MPPTRWKREEEDEEGEANHRQTLNSLTPSRLQTAPLASPSRTAGLLSPSPCFCDQPSFSIPPGRGTAPKEEPALPSDRCTPCPEPLPPALPQHTGPLPTSAAPPWGPRPHELRGHTLSLLLQRLCSFRSCSPALCWSLQVGNTPLGSQVLETPTDTRGSRLRPKALL